MKRYRVEVTRLVEDIETVWTEVEAENEGHAELKALQQAYEQDGFWDDATPEPLESGRPRIEKIEELDE